MPESEALNDLPQFDEECRSLGVRVQDFHIRLNCSPSSIRHLQRELLGPFGLIAQRAHIHYHYGIRPPKL